jgi:hypothetical protein
VGSNSSEQKLDKYTNNKKTKAVTTNMETHEIGNLGYRKVKILAHRGGGKELYL